MSRQSNPAIIGAFVVGAVSLLALGFIVFGGSQIFATKIRYVALFDEPTNGLRVGANVLLNGVRIGYVSDIDLLIDEITFQTETQVTLEILTEDYIMTRNGEAVEPVLPSFIDHDILVNKAGLRATLQVESFVTGQLRVELLFRPDTPSIMRSADPPYPEIPTMASNTQEILDRVQNWFTDFQENVDLPRLASQLSDVLAGIDQIVYSEDLRQAMAGLNTLVNDEDTQNMGRAVRLALRDLRDASDSAEQMFRNTAEDFELLVGDARPVLRSLDEALTQASAALKAAERQLRGDSEQLYQLQVTAAELERAARALREFFDYLERNPEALIRGKKE